MAQMLTAAETGADGALMMIGDPDYYGRFFAFTAAATGAWDLPGPFETHRLLARAANGHALPIGAGMIGPRASSERYIRITTQARSPCARRRGPFFISVARAQER